MTDPYLFIDVVNKTRVSGWCINGDSINVPVRLLFYLDDIGIGETHADLPRQDLKDLDFHPTGRCGFDFSIPADIDLDRYGNFYIRAPDACNHLQKISTNGLPEVFHEHLKQLFFMHIPKTGGTSFNTFFRTVLPGDSTAVLLEHIEPDAQRALAVRNAIWPDICHFG